MNFLCDIMVQKLGKILILCGYDTKIIKQITPITELINISNNEKRILITRNTKLKNYPNTIVLIEQKPYEQFKKIIKILNINLNEENFFTRCQNCSAILERIEKQKIIDKILPLTIKNTENFYLCKNCNKIYWKASHYDNFLKKIKELI